VRKEGCHLLIEETEHVPTTLLGVVHRRVGARKKRLPVRGIDREARNTDTR
jgi:hypothetical protein